MPRYKIVIEYDGTDYSGWQRQPNSPTVEEEIEKALSQILREPIDIKGQGRTDSGVHAEAQVAHFDISRELNSGQLLYALLGVLPRDIAVYEMKEVSDDFHARFDAKSRRYRYQIMTRPGPLRRHQALMVLNELDVDAMRRCADMIHGIHNFESFTKSSAGQEHTKCDIICSEFEQNGSMLIYYIEANRFLHHMVRRLVGTILQVGKGKENVNYFEQLLHNPQKKISGHGAPARGLILEKVTY